MYCYLLCDYCIFNDYVWVNNWDNYCCDDDDIYDIVDYYENDFGCKNIFIFNIN